MVGQLLQTDAISSSPRTRLPPALHGDDRSIRDIDTNCGNTAVFGLAYANEAPLSRDFFRFCGELRVWSNREDVICLGEQTPETWSIHLESPISFFTAIGEMDYASALGTASSQRPWDLRMSSTTSRAAPSPPRALVTK